ncbi:MAG: ABC transporter permease [bacterium]|jgi:peptide/nickel transport system permease protein
MPSFSWDLIWRQFRKHRLATIAAVVMAMLILLSLAGPMLSPYSFREYDAEAILQPPSSRHPLGTDELGRDILTRLLWGGRVSLSVGIAAMLVALAIGTTFGALAGYYGGILDNVLMRLTDLVLAFPALFLYLILSAFFNTGLFHLILIIGSMSWMEVARLVRGAFLTLKQLEYAQAARAVGAGDRRIIFRHLLPNALASLIVATILGIASAILYEAALSYLGLGIQPPWPSWGNMLSNSQSYVWTAPALAVYPGLCIFVTVLCCNLLGDGLRDALDPRLKQTTE